MESHVWQKCLHNAEAGLNFLLWSKNVFRLIQELFTSYNNFGPSPGEVWSTANGTNSPAKDSSKMQWLRELTSARLPHNRMPI